MLDGAVAIVLAPPVPLGEKDSESRLLHEVPLESIDPLRHPVAEPELIDIRAPTGSSCSFMFNVTPGVSIPYGADGQRRTSEGRREPALGVTERPSSPSSWCVATAVIVFVTLMTLTRRDELIPTEPSGPVLAKPAPPW